MGPKNSIQIVLSKALAGSGRLVKQEQGQISCNHVLDVYRGERLYSEPEIKVQYAGTSLGWAGQLSKSRNKVHATTYHPLFWALYIVEFFSAFGISSDPKTWPKLCGSVHASVVMRIFGGRRKEKRGNWGSYVPSSSGSGSGSGGICSRSCFCCRKNRDGCLRQLRNEFRA